MKTSLPALFLLALALPGCAAGDATPEEVAREYFAACDARDWDAVWDLGAAPCRNLWAEARDDLENPPPYDLWLPTAGIAEIVDPKDGVGMTPRELHDAVNEAGAKKSKPLGEPGPEDLEIHVEGDRAEVVWAERDARIFLLREDGEWRVLARGLASKGDVFFREGPGGREPSATGAAAAPSLGE